MRRIRLYRFVISPFFLGSFLILYYISALFIPIESDIRSIPAFLGYWNPGVLPEYVSVFLELLFLVLTAISIFLFDKRNLLIGRSIVLLPLIYLIFAVSSPNSVFFSGSTVTTLLVLWSVYYSIFTRKGDKELFLSGFLISFAALFDTYAIFLIPLIVFFSLRSILVTLRSVIILATAVIIPFALIFSLEYFIFGDSMFLLRVYIKDLSYFSFLDLNIKSVANFFKIIALFIFLFLAVKYSLANITKYKTLKSNSFVRLISLLVVNFLIALMYPLSVDCFTQINAFPVSILVLEYVSTKEKPTMKRVGYLIVLIFIAMSRIAVFL
jgi:hypothetical protein